MILRPLSSRLKSSSSSSSQHCTSPRHQPSKATSNNNDTANCLSACDRADDSLGAEEGVREDRVAGDAVAERDELLVVDEEDLDV